MGNSKQLVACLSLAIREDAYGWWFGMREQFFDTWILAKFHLPKVKVHLWHFLPQVCICCLYMLGKMWNWRRRNADIWEGIVSIVWSLCGREEDNTYDISSLCTSYSWAKSSSRVLQWNFATLPRQLVSLRNWDRALGLQYIKGQTDRHLATRTHNCQSLWL